MSVLLNKSNSRHFQSFSRRRKIKIKGIFSNALCWPWYVDRFEGELGVFLLRLTKRVTLPFNKSTLRLNQKACNHFGDQCFNEWQQKLNLLSHWGHTQLRLSLMGKRICAVRQVAVVTGYKDGRWNRILSPKQQTKQNNWNENYMRNYTQFNSDTCYGIAGDACMTGYTTNVVMWLLIFCQTCGRFSQSNEPWGQFSHLIV